MKKRGKATVVQKTVKDPELIEMFNRMVGATDPDPNIVIPKYERIHNYAQEVVQLLQKLATSPLAKAYSVDNKFMAWFDQIRVFVHNSSGALENMALENNDNILTGEELQAINADPEKMIEFLKNSNAKYKVAKLGEKYSKLRESHIIKEMIMIARNLKNMLALEQARSSATHHCLENKDALSDAFILNSDGDYLTIFNFSGLDLKQTFYSDLLTPQFRKYLLLVLHLIYTRVMAIVKDITSPDIDVNQFSEIVIKNIDEMRKMVPRCDKAFDKLKNSVGLLKGNFGGYYKDFITSQASHPGIIIENFILDVAGSNKADLETTRQFRQILDFYTKQMSGRKISDPKVKKMMSLIGENLDILEGRLDRTSVPATSAASTTSTKTSFDEDDEESEEREE
jgi:mRNA-degrading endonuclease YafQ of YafQ-DinJ toxin-antitoxin module